MNERIRVGVGVLLTGVFVGLGLVLLAERRTVEAVVLLALGSVRGAIAVRQGLALRAKPRDAEPPPG